MEDGTRGLTTPLAGLVKADRWWEYKVPLFMAFVYYLIARAPVTAPGGWRLAGTLALFQIAILGMAGFGHLCNDWFDIEADLRAGKRNVLASRRPSQRAALVLGFLALAFLPWLVLPVNAVNLPALVAEAFLLAAYAVPPLRLKERPAGVIADALYGYTVPVVITWGTFGSPNLDRDLLVVLVWVTLVGVRSILNHQLLDLENDTRSDVRTLARRLGRSTTTAILVRLVLPLEAATFVLVSALLVWTVPWYGVFALLFIPWRAFQIAYVWRSGRLGKSCVDAYGAVQLYGYIILNEYYEKAMPVLFLAGLVVTRVELVWLLFAHLVIFRQNVLARFPSDAKGIRTGWSELLAARPDRRRRRSEGGTFVFVVCGPEEHLRTLDRSLRQLRKLSSKPILVVTDLSRNRIPIDHTQVLDVRTPTGLSDHQASIYLKTGLHRWLKEGELYCYVDSDVFAVCDDVDSIFDHYAPPITFASDLPTPSMTVARFSPWALHCGCNPKATYACMHLTEAIERRFGLRVPSDWSNWNGGVFLFGPESRDFLESWHQTTLEVFGFEEWRVRDQGSLIVTAWRFGLGDHRRLPLEYNFLVDFDNPGLTFDREAGYALDEGQPFVRPRFLHLYHCALDSEDWSFARDVEERLDRATRERRAARRLLPAGGWPRRRRPGPFEVVVATDAWVPGPASRHSEALVRGLLAAGHRARILLTESLSPLVGERESLEPVPTDLPVVHLPVPNPATWGAHWGTLIRFLEESRGPQLYLPAEDLRSSVVCSKLSDRIRIVTTLYHDSETTYDQASRLGAFWNAVVGVDPRIRDTLRARQPDLGARSVTIPLPIRIPSSPRVLEPGAEFTILCIPPLPAELGRMALSAREAGIPVSWTVSGLEGGPLTEKERLAALESGFLGPRSTTSPAAFLETLGSATFILSGAALLGHRTVRQAAALGCLPLAWGYAGESSPLVKGVTGHHLEEPLATSLVARLTALRARPDRHAEMIRHAHRRAREVEISEEEMVERYLDVFEQVERMARRGSYRRPAGMFAPPPRRVGKDVIFGVEEEDVLIPGVGTFLRPRFAKPWDEYAGFRGAVHEELRARLPEIAKNADPTRPETWVVARW